MVSVDNLTELCDGTALNGGVAGTYNLGTIDLGSTAPGDVSVRPTYIVIAMKTAATSGGSATATFRVVTGAGSTISTSTGEVLLQTPVFALADMAAGKRLFAVPLPAATDAVPYLRYLGLQQTTAVAAFTGGTVDCYLTDKVPTHAILADGAPTPA